MRGNTRNWLICAAMAAGIFLFMAVPTWAAIATGTGEITNIQYGLVNPGDGIINWFYDDGFGGPDWQGEAWVEAFFIRQGKLVGRDHFIMDGTQDEEPSEV